MFKPINTLLRENPGEKINYSTDSRFLNPKNGYYLGLCNSLYYNTINQIITTPNEKTYLVLDGFNICSLTSEICPISEILDLKETTNNIQRLGYNFSNYFLIDRELPSFRVLNVEKDNQKIKIVWTTGNYYTPFVDIYHSNTILFNKLSCLSIEEIPELFKYHIQNDVWNMKFGLIIRNPFNPFSRDPYILFLDDDFSLQNPFTNNAFLFNQIAKCITFKECFYQAAESIFINKKLNFSDNVCHLRCEYDYIRFLAKNVFSIDIGTIHDNEERTEHHIKLGDLCRDELLKTYDEVFSKIKGRIVILSYIPDEKIINFLNEKYDLVIIDKEEKDNIIKEKCGYNGYNISAIVDLLLAKLLYGHFISAFEPCFCGSSFSYILEATGKYSGYTRAGFDVTMKNIKSRFDNNDF